MFAYMVLGRILGGTKIYAYDYVIHARSGYNVWKTTVHVKWGCYSHFCVMEVSVLHSHS